MSRGSGFLFKKGLKKKREINQQYFKIVHLHFLKSEFNFRALEVVGRVSETQLQVSENYNFLMEVKALIVIHVVPSGQTIDQHSISIWLSSWCYMCTVHMHGKG